MRTTVIEVRTGDEERVVDLTDRSRAFVREDGGADGLLPVFVPHATAGHGRDHVLPALVAPFATLPVVDGELAPARLTRARARNGGRAKG